MLSPRLRKWLSFIEETPLHPQWLLRRGMRNEKLIKYAQGYVLDVGCASRWPERLLPVECKYIALDYPPTGGALYAATPDVFADAAALPFSSKTFDTVLFFEVLEHVEEPRKTLEEIARVLKPGGSLILSMPFLYPMHDEPHDYQRFTAHGLARELRACGLSIQAIQPNLNASATAGLIVCLALAGMILEATRKRSPSLLLAPFLITSIPLINLSFWLLSQLLPNWPALSAGHFAVAVKS
ncbi:MAG: methyltransferase domain-containing protein [Wenzhouxiangella sp.]